MAPSHPLIQVSHLKNNSMHDQWSHQRLVANFSYCKDLLLKVINIYVLLFSFDSWLCYSLFAYTWPFCLSQITIFVSFVYASQLKTHSLVCDLRVCLQRMSKLNMQFIHIFKMDFWSINQPFSMCNQLLLQQMSPLTCPLMDEFGSSYQAILIWHSNTILPLAVSTTMLLFTAS